NRISEMDIDSLTIEQYLMLTEGNQAPNMDQCNAHYDLPSLLRYFEPIQPHTQDRYESLDEDIDFVSEDKSEIEDLDEWLKTEMEKRMCRQDKESREDALIDMLKSLMEECKI
nr:hypothetical protein [Tanacetum cinerariifolium]